MEVLCAKDEAIFAENLRKQTTETQVSLLISFQTYSSQLTLAATQMVVFDEQGDQIKHFIAHTFSKQPGTKLTFLYCRLLYVAGYPCEIERKPSYIILLFS